MISKKSGRKNRSARNRKGFIQMIEAILASIILFGSVSYFFMTTRDRSEWELVSLRTEASDALTVLEKNGELATYIKNMDANMTDSRLTELMRKSIGFSLSVTGMPKPVVYIGCLCSPGETDELAERLMPGSAINETFNFGIRKMDIRIENVTTSSDVELMDALVVMDKNKFIGNLSYIQGLLDDGKKVVLISDLSQADITTLQSIFDLSSSTGSCTDQSFYNRTNLDMIAYKVSKYFVRTPFFVNTTTGSGSFVIRKNSYTIQAVDNGTSDYIVYNSVKYFQGSILTIDGSKLNVTRISDNAAAVDLRVIDKNNTFKLDSATKVKYDASSILKNPNGDCSAAKTNSNRNALWIAAYPKTHSDMNQLMKASIISLADVRWGFDPYDIDPGQLAKKTAPSVYRQIERMSYNGEDVYSIAMKTWFIY